MNTQYLSKEEIIQKIVKSKKCLGIIGTTAFDFSLDSDEIIQSQGKSLRNILSEKFHAEGSDYTITIIRESEPQILQYVQYQYTSKEVGSKDLEYYRKINKSYGVGNIEDNSVNGFREFLKAQKNQNLEPTENICRKTLDEIFDNERIKGIVEKLNDRDYEDITITSEIISILISIFERSEQIRIINTPEYEVVAKGFDGNENKIFLQSFAEWFKSLMSKNLKSITCSEDLLKLPTLYREISFNEIFSYKTFNFDVNFALKDIAELRTTLVEACFEYLAQVEDEDYDEIKNSVSSDAFQKRKRALKKFKEDAKYKQRFILKTLFDFIETQLLKIDDEYFSAYPYEQNKFIYIGEDNGQNSDMLLQISKRLFEKYCSSNNATEVTDKGDRDEYVNAYIQVEPNKKTEHERQNRIRVGLRARESFNYKKPQSMQFVKNVAWALVFDHDGNLLLHRRGMNAKDNQGMWDKSVGGHIAHNDPDAIFGARREILEELYETEGIEQSHNEKKDDNKDKLATKDPEKIRFFGQWKLGFYPKLNKGIHLDPEEFYCFKYDFEQIRSALVSERKLPSGQLVHNKCFVDLFFVVTSDAFDVSTLKNSKYLLLPPGIIRDFYNSKKLPAQFSPTGTTTRFEVTPDLSFMIENETFWGTVRQFSDEVREAFSMRRKKV